MKKHLHITHTRVLIVGAGPAGLGVSLALQRAGVTDQLVIDAREVGAAFRAWPNTMSLLTPSFYSNAFGLTDLNSIDPDTSPADFLHTQHPNGEGYAKYLEAIVSHFQLPVRPGVKVTSVKKESARFIVQSEQGEIHADYVVWAAGQFFHPRDHDFPGAEHALHSSRVPDWSALEGDEFTVIGGYESGVDAALNLVHLGKSVRLISRGEPWASDDPDPSRSLSPRTLDRLRELLKTPEKAGLIEFVKNTTIKSIEKGPGFWTLRDQDEIPLATTTRPILANGFHNGLGIVSDHFEYDESNNPIFTEEADESTRTPGLFYSGPALVHRNALFCFIYKFRARFGVIAAEIATRLGLPEVEANLKTYADAGFMNRDLDCCTNCECAIDPDDAETPEPASFAQL
ncbi:NAD(P)-binding domain-containing protein [Verrucomicrobiaceae bacterium 5K15]|uniref:NAD(P)-binding domain-containing protein n=1 Tax=Oceaniferula flava TaxID=2800421 RepID=A0AAE2SFX3_9BACT|nr:NAD(P)-binding domain-containing protein [Oceaniferula flavus]MBK1855621.1 NAD(P)-binding domain-containing protein [Oceaniferula flavus]MBM1136927.1 NAD(P)-binding domain-containing protein [Oceaniferula flavus]